MTRKPTEQGRLFGAYLASWRNTAPMGRSALAERVCVSRQHIADMESGKSLPGSALCRRLSEVLAIPLDQVLAACGRLPPDLQRGLASEPSKIVKVRAAIG